MSLDNTSLIRASSRSVNWDPWERLICNNGADYGDGFALEGLFEKENAASLNNL